VLASGAAVRADDGRGAGRRRVEIPPRIEAAWKVWVANPK
jgi:hypothetical protein